MFSLRIQNQGSQHVPSGSFPERAVQQSRAVAKMDADVRRMMEQMFGEALYEAGENYQQSAGQKNNTLDEGVEYIEYGRDNKKHRAINSSPLSRRSVKQRSSSMTPRRVSDTAAAEILGIGNIADKTDSVKTAILDLAEIYASIGSKKPVLGLSRVVNGENLQGSLIAVGVLAGRGNNGSAYRRYGGHELRMSNHSAHASNFKGEGEHLSIALYKTQKVNNFLPSEPNVIEAVFRKDYLNDNPNVLKSLIKDIAHFIANGEYHDTAGALKYNFSGSEGFVQTAKIRMAEDAAERERQVKAVQNLNQIDITMDQEAESIAPSVMFSERTWQESDYVTAVNQAADDIAKNKKKKFCI